MRARLFDNLRYVATNKEQYHGVIKLVGRMAGQLLIGAPAGTTVVFEGRNKAEAKRQMLKYWSQHEQELGIGLGEFQRRCAQKGEHTIVFRA